MVPESGAGSGRVIATGELTGKERRTVNNDPNVISSIEELKRFLAEHPDARIASVERVSTNTTTGEQTRQTLFRDGTLSHENGQTNNRETEAKEKAVEEAKKKQAEYENALETWKKEMRGVEQKRALELTKAMEAEKTTHRGQILADYAEAVRSAAKSFAEAELNENRLQEDLNMLGNFRNSERKAIQKALETVQEQKKDAKNRAQEAKRIKENALMDLPNYISRIKPRLEGEVADHYPGPPKPVLSQYMSRREQEMLKNRPGSSRTMTAKQAENEMYKEDIMACLEPNVCYSAENVQKLVPSIVASGMSINRVAALLQQLTDEGCLNKTVDRRMNYYSMA